MIIKLVIVGSEVPLAAGIADSLNEAGKDYFFCVCLSLLFETLTIIKIIKIGQFLLQTQYFVRGATTNDLSFKSFDETYSEKFLSLSYSNYYIVILILQLYNYYNITIVILL